MLETQGNPRMDEEDRPAKDMNILPFADVYIGRDCLTLKESALHFFS